MFDPASITILAVDDEEGMLDLAATIFRRAGYNVVTARSGIEAMSVVMKKVTPSIRLDGTKA